MNNYKTTYKAAIYKGNDLIASCTSNDLVKQYLFLKDHEWQVTLVAPLELKIAEAATVILKERQNANFYKNLYHDFKDEILAMASLQKALLKMKYDNEYFGMALKALKKIVNVIMTDKEKAPLQLAILLYITGYISETPVEFISWPKK